MILNYIWFILSACIDPTAAGGVADHIAELLGALCSTRPFGSDAPITLEQAITAKGRTAAALEWLQHAGESALRRDSIKLPCACCVYEIAAVLWSEQADEYKVRMVSVSFSDVI